MGLSGRYREEPGQAIERGRESLTDRLPPEVEIGALSVVQEALITAARHAQTDAARPGPRGAGSAAEITRRRSRQTAAPRES